MNACNNTTEHQETSIQEYQHQMYAVFYTVILVPGLIGNVLALWVFYGYIKETKKAVIFMINLAIADLLQVLSLPLRIYYYLNNSWPFGDAACMLCFYLKYVNMYASIYFLACISVRRCHLIIQPLHCGATKRRRERGLCLIGWLIVCLGCLPFPLLRKPNTNSAQPTRCFSELPMTPLSKVLGVSLVTFAEMLGFLLPLGIVVTCSWLTAASLRQKTCVLQDTGEKHKALKMVLSCAGVFLVCFVPYHITFPLDFLAKSNYDVSSAFKNAVLHVHPVTLCLASLNCCLDPVMYYFTTDEFKRRLSRPEFHESLPLQHRTSFSTNASLNQTDEARGCCFKPHKRAFCVYN
ncbi:probable G-protein coupled receptor 174 [Sinocyclocheilus anshuiensis]|uniref:probable G-protein coupled receptor 174 n=1 Tax=Sinocyclocheilus anshuiensis TaxID=1608454 RepID=UPI0007B9E964|nr:PREDICTED: probable G-protein coupled receptor 174 [Sinocyclocheilus anshuiensis]